MRPDKWSVVALEWYLDVAAVYVNWFVALGLLVGAVAVWIESRAARRPQPAQRDRVSTERSDPLTH